MGCWCGETKFLWREGSVGRAKKTSGIALLSSSLEEETITCIGDDGFS